MTKYYITYHYSTDKLKVAKIGACFVTMQLPQKLTENDVIDLQKIIRREIKDFEVIAVPDLIIIPLSWKEVRNEG